MSEEIHPGPNEFTEEEIARKPILRFFHYSHLPKMLQTRSMPFCRLAREMHDTLPDCEERDVMLRRLLEAKDCAVRAAVCRE